MTERILDRIRKLLRLADNAGSEAEAALAAERAAQLMAQHEIHEAQLALDGPNEPRTPEVIERSYEVTKTQKRVAWHMRIAGAVARSYGAHAYWHGGSVVLFGRLSAVQAASYTAQYLMREVERLTDRQAPSPSYSRRYRNSFRLGCASRLKERLDAETIRARRAAGHADLDDDDLDDLPVEAAEAARPIPTEPPPASAGVLMKVGRDRAEVKTAYDDFSKKFGKAHVGQVSSGSGYSAGKAAGDGVSLGGGGRGALPRGQGTLKR